MTFLKVNLLLRFMEWYNEDKEKTPITVDEIDLFIKEKTKQYINPRHGKQ